MAFLCESGMAFGIYVNRATAQFTFHITKSIFEAVEISMDVLPRIESRNGVSKTASKIKIDGHLLPRTLQSLNAHIHQAVMRISHSLKPDPLRGCWRPIHTTAGTAIAAHPFPRNMNTRHIAIAFRCPPPPAIALQRRLRKSRTILQAQTRGHSTALEVIGVKIVITHTLVAFSRNLKMSSLCCSRQ